MIKFVCMLCHEKLSVQEQLSGKRIKCPKCSNAVVVPAESPTIKFACKNCGKGIRVLQIHAGKQGKCPKCKSAVAVPPLSADPTDGSETVTLVCSMCNEKIRMPKGSQERFIECPACGSNVESSLGAESPEPDSSIPSSADEDEYEEEYDQSEEDEGPDRRLIFVIAGAAVIVVVGLIILITVILPSGSEPIEQPSVSPRQEMADADSPSAPVDSGTQPTGAFTLEPPKEDAAVKVPTGSPAAASDDARNLDLKLRLKPGQKHKLRITREARGSETIDGRQSDGNSTNAMGMEFEVEQVDPNGVIRLKVTYLTIHVVRNTERGRWEYNSTTPAAATNNPAEFLFSTMIGQSFMVKVTTEGEVVELKGIGEMYQRIAGPLVKWYEEDSKRRARMKDLTVTFAPREQRIEFRRKWLEMSTYVGREVIREMLGNAIMPFPRGPVGIGDSWQVRAALYSVGSATLGLYDCTYTLT
ncbi:MAG: DUF6263 family protein, partial [Planctomycetota bacterium]|nr:DUF6263 family protein [Planctomycetota bacterium]